MKITREEFKELVALYTEMFHKSCMYSEYLNENFIDDLMFPAFNWIEKKLSLSIENEDYNILSDLTTFNHVLIPRVENNEVIWEEVSDLDAIYDYYLKEQTPEEKAERARTWESILLLEEKMSNLEESLNA